VLAGIYLPRRKPGHLDDYALASRLSFFLWNSAPDDELRRCAAKNELHQPDVLRAQTERLLNNPKSRQFVDAFLDYWLDLRKILATAPDSGLYPDYYLDDLLTESALEETQVFFAELLRGDLPARNLVASDFAMLNERLAAHYGLPPVQGVALRRVPLPKDSPRGGLMTQAAVLKVTANGTTTSPVLRGAWIMERILGQKPPPPPPSVPAVEPDIRGAVTIRQQLEKHRTLETCNACHAKIDPAGFRAGKFRRDGRLARSLPRGRRRRAGKRSRQERTEICVSFGAAGGCKRRTSGRSKIPRRARTQATHPRRRETDRPQISRGNSRFMRRAHRCVSATARPSSKSCNAPVSSHYGVRSIIHEVVQSELFLNK